MPEIPAERRANVLDGKAWTRNSISVWDDIRFTLEERRRKHPAMFPSQLVERLIHCFTTAVPHPKRILDPFSGSGSTVVTAARLGQIGIGFELYEKFLDLARARCGELNPPAAHPPELHAVDSRRLSEFVPADSIDLCVTSPPYWDILSQKRTADFRTSEAYGQHTCDLGEVDDYHKFLAELSAVFAGVFRALKPGAYCVINVMDLRKKDRFFPLHCDLSRQLPGLGFLFDDLIIWDRRADYNSLRPLGFPYVFRINKVHEYLLIFQKPRA